MIYATLGSIACLITGALVLWWIRKLDSTQPKDPAEWRKQ